MSLQRCEVAVVGGGIAGAAIALGLLRQGVDVQLFDRDPPMPALDANDYDLRVYALSIASQRYLQDIGVWDAIVAERACAYSQMQVWETEPHDALKFDAAEARAAALGHIVEGRVIQRQLWRALPPDNVHHDCAVESLQIDDDSAQLKLADGGTVVARLVIAADSARSPLRTQQGIEVSGQRYAQTAVVCHVRTGEPHRSTAYQRFLPTGPLAFLPLADGRSSIVWSSTEAQQLLAMDDWTFRLSLDEAIQHALGPILECTERVSFPLQLQNALEYVKPRFALVGDAAHVVHPLAGQGLNLGLGDAAELVAVITAARAARRDVGSPRVLARYQRARRAEVNEMIAVTDGLYRAYRVQLPGWDWLRQRGLLAVKAIAPLRQLLVRRACGL